jgi:hypothetical protein
MADAENKIHVDSDWKAQAQAEKELLEKKVEAKQEERRQAEQLPEATFRGLLSVLATPAIMSLGTQRDPKTGGVFVDLEGAKFYIDLLAVIEEKTAGNLSEEEAREVKLLIHELRGRFVEVTGMLAEAASHPAAAHVGSPGSPGSHGTPGTAPKSEGASKLIMPD